MIDRQLRNAFSLTKAFLLGPAYPYRIIRLKTISIETEDACQIIRFQQA